MTVFNSDRKRLNRELQEIERKLAQNPLAVVEVELEAAELMGAFAETAVSLEDFELCEPGALDWFFEAGPEKGSNGGSNGAL